MQTENPTPCIEAGLGTWRRALCDEFDGSRQEPLISLDAAGESDEDDLSVYFVEIDETMALDWFALSQCRGRVLDIAATAGRHSLSLQSRGVEVCALDLLPECVDIMRRRGVADVICADAFTWRSTLLFDTVLLLYDAVGIAGNLSGLTSLLENIRHNLARGGQILVQSEVVPADERWGPEGDYWGEETFEFEYQGRHSPPFPWLSVDPDTLAEYCEDWRIDVLFEHEGEYIGRLTKVGDPE